MLKLVVYGLGWGGELVADYLAEELQMVEVTRVIDWDLRPDPQQPLAMDKLYDGAIRSLANHFGKTDLIVLGGYTVAGLINLLQQNFPEQRFVTLGVDLRSVLRTRNYPRQVVLLMDKIDTETENCQLLQQGLPNATILLPDCTVWEQMIDDDEMNFEELYHTFVLDFILQADVAKLRPLIRTLQAEAGTEELPASRNQYQPDTIILLSSHFWGIKVELERLFGYSARVLDFREKLLHDVCRILKLRGVDGKCRYS